MAKKLIERLKKEKIKKIFPTILDYRIPFIEDISNRFRENYLRDGRIDWRVAASEEGILYFEDERAVIPFCIHNPKAIFVQPYGIMHSSVYCDVNRAHEFGHILLGHDDSNLFGCSDDEADYFGGCVLRMNVKKKSLENIKILPNILRLDSLIGNIFFKDRYTNFLIRDNLEEIEF